MSAATLSRKRKALPEACDDVDTCKASSPKSRKTTEASTSRIARGNKSRQHIATDQTDSVVSRAPRGKHATVNPKKSKRQRSPEACETPRHKRFKNISPPTPEETPTRGASKLFDKLNLAQGGSITDLSKKLQAYQSPPDTPQKRTLEQDAQSIPPFIDELKRQYAALLQAYSLYVAHYGASHPKYLHELAARVTKTWRKRSIEAHDIRVMLGILGEASPFELLDNGEDAVCMEIRRGHDDISHRMVPLITDFERRLQKRWLRWCASVNVAQLDGEAFVASLPQAHPRRSEVAADPARKEQGAAWLAAMKATRSAATTRQSPTRKIESVAKAAKTSSGTASRGALLLDRVLAKQALALNGSDAPPTQAELARRAALDRVHGVARVLDFLAGSRTRASFSMQDLVRQLQNSMRNPIARDEAELCLTLMAREVCPAFVKVVQSGGLNYVVVMKVGRPDDELLIQTLRRL